MTKIFVQTTITAVLHVYQDFLVVLGKVMESKHSQVDSGRLGSLNAIKTELFKLAIAEGVFLIQILETVLQNLIKVIVNAWNYFQ